MSTGIDQSRMGKVNKISRSFGEVAFDRTNAIFLVILSFLTIYPFWYVLVLSLSEGNAAAKGPVWFWPRGFTFSNYLYVLNYASLQEAFLVTAARCVIGTSFSVAVSMLAAYSLSKRFLPGRKAILYFFILPMFIGGSIISNYVVIAKLGLLNNFFVYILPGAFGFFGMVIMRTFIEGIPAELEECTMLDGAGYWIIFTRIILPLSKPILAAFLFFGVVGGWLDFYTNLTYVTERKLYTLQYILYMVIQQNEAANMIDIRNASESIKRLQEARGAGLPTPTVIKMSVMVIVTFPILFIYPFFQKYFVKGMLIGAIKA